MFMRVISTGSTKGNCYSLQSSTGEIVLLDCGCNYKKILRGIDYKIRNVVGCLLTHSHDDHKKSFKDLMNAGLQIYTNDETVENLNIMTGELMIGLPERRTRLLTNEFNGFAVTPFYVPHDDTPNFGYVIAHPEMGLIIYATDFMHFPYSFRNMNINHFLIECNHMDDTPERGSFKFEHSIRGHSSLSTVKEIIRVNKTTSLRTVTLCHLSDGWGDPDRMQEEIQEVVGEYAKVQIAKTGLEVDLNLCPF